MSIRQVPVETRAAWVDDFTGTEITSGGWALGGIHHDLEDPVLHFKSLTNLVEAVLTQPEIFGLSRGSDFVPRALARRGINVSLPD